MPSPYKALNDASRLAHAQLTGASPNPEAAENMATQESPNKSRYLMIIGGEKRFLPLLDAGVAYDFGFAPVEIGGLVLEEDGLVRDITPEERKRICEIADEYSALK